MTTVSRFASERASVSAMTSMTADLRVADLMTLDPVSIPLDATIEEAAANVLAPAQQQLVDGMLERWVIDEPVAAAARIRSLADSFGVDEVMVVPGLSAHDSDDPASAPARVKALELLAGQLLS